MNVNVFVVQVEYDRVEPLRSVVIQLDRGENIFRSATDRKHRCDFGRI